MEKMIIALFTAVIFLIGCNDNNKEALNDKNIIGKWEKNPNASSTEALEITKEGNNYFIDTYTYFKKPTKYVKSNGDTTIMTIGSSVNHKKTELLYGNHEESYIWGKEGLSSDVKLIDNDHLEFRAQVYNRVK